MIVDWDGINLRKGETCKVWWISQENKLKGEKPLNASDANVFIA